MLHSVMQKRQARQYAFVNGFRNIAWLTGYVQRLNSHSLHISSGQSGIPLPVLLEPSPTATPLYVGQAVSLYCRVTTTAEEGASMPMLKAFGMERPSLINLSPREIFSMALEAPSERTDDGESLPDLVGPLANTVHLSGLVEHMEGLPDSRIQGFYVLLKQQDKGKASIPVRIHGKNQAQYRKRLQVGMPIFIEGQYRVRVDSRHERLQPMIQATAVRVPQRGKDMLTIPDWAFRFMSERTADPELRMYLDQMRCRDSSDASAGNPPVVIDEL